MSTSILKATESRKYTDPTFAFNDSQAALAGVPVGAYHVWTPSGSTDDAKAEANHFVHVVQPGVGDVLPVLDMEMNRVPDGMPASVLQTWARAWLNRVALKTGVRPMVYGSQYLFQTMLGNTTWFADHGYRLWFAWPRSPCRSRCLPTTGKARVAVLAALLTGRVKGIHGDVDQDRYVGPNLQTAPIAQVTAQPGTGGSITDTSGVISCPATQTCAALYSPTDVLELTATPDTGCSFVSWCCAASSRRNRRTPSRSATTARRRSATRSR